MSEMDYEIGPIPGAEAAAPSALAQGLVCLNFELERLIARCPKLKNVAHLCSLLEKGHELEEEQLVNALAMVLLHPSYTIPIMGCFRSIAKKIINRVVELLKLVPNLRFDHPGGITNSMEDSYFIDCEELEQVYLSGVIEAYSRRGRFLDLHELASLAFSRVLDLAPFLRGAIECYYEFGGPPFHRIIEATFISKVKSEPAARHLRNLVWTSYRLLLLDPEFFSCHWNWCCFLDLVHQAASFDGCFSTELARDIRWCGVQILCILLKLPSRTAVLGMEPVEVLPSLLRWHEFCWDVSIEKAGWFVSKKVSDGDASFSGGGEAIAIDLLKLLEYEPEKFKKKLQRDCSPFLLTSSIQSSYERVILAINQKWPVLLYGPPGCGKTALISKLAQEIGTQVLSIHMDEQIDGRTLVGSYVCTEQPGEFRWQPGPLTQAVKNGVWVVFENIDQAASDVQSILLPLLEGGTSFLTGYGEGIRVAEGFRLFSTISTSKADICSHAEGRNALSALWRRVMVKPAACTDLANVVSAWYPDLVIAWKLIETFETLNGDSELFGTGQSGCKNSTSRFSLRDLLKWCKRIAGSGFSISFDGLSADLCRMIYLEAVDVFAVNAASPGTRLNIVRNIAKMWAVPVSEAEALYCLNRPVLKDFIGAVQIGRVTLPKKEDLLHEKKPFVEIRSSFHVLERIACAVKWNEAVLLVGETGTGKTTLVQNLATRLGQKLTVLNLSQQSDVADLLGGFRPMDPQYICVPLYKEFESLFMTTFSVKDNQDFLALLKKLVNDKNWTKLLTGFKKGVERVVRIGRCGSGTKRKRPLEERVLGLWENLSQKVEIARNQLAGSSGMIFSFVEGAFVTALRNGEWILLDEVNLAPPETLQRIIGVLDGESGSLCLAENGVVVDRHSNFRMFACMNPATDAGKRDLPYSLRSRFTEYFVDDVLEDEDLTLFVNQFLDDRHTDKDLANKIVRFYKMAKKESEEKLQDGANQKPQYSLRSLYRALEYIRKARKLGFKRAVYDGFCMFFMTLLEDRSAEMMNERIISFLLGDHKQLPPPIPLEQLLNVKEKPGSEQFLREYVITKSVEEHIRSLARAVYIKRYPVLLQGPTSSGKTSLVQYLAAKTGHEFVRINNHEHTDLQEYLGSYITDASGRLVFHEGVLVKAVRYGHWIVLDELNLAPSDVLEALNRLLDDNRELFVPELRETVRAHPNFMLFATQNPPTFYGGRKMLSRAFRNRFVEIHVNDIPDDELTEILEKKCKIPRSYTNKMIEVMKELQLRRQKSKVFAGKHGFITPRDLFRWANRFSKYGTSYEDLAKDGYFLLAERLRDEIEKNIVQEVLEKHLRVKLKKDELYKQGSIEMKSFQENVGDIVWTKSMQRLYFLIERCYQLKEPVLLVGETGGGKTTVCQLLSMALSSKLHILNCHQYTETSDFIGGFYPVRERSRIASEFKNLIEHLVISLASIHFDIEISSDIGKAPSTLKQLGEVLDECKCTLVSMSDGHENDLASIEKTKAELSQLYQQWQTIFVWQDGPLVQAMKNGDLLLVDEISLADDSVLERLNSVLEPDRKLSLAEKGGPSLETITASDDFFLLATMNPGGDFGKKELSPALRNRFTEIWVPPVDDLDELRGIAERFLNPKLHCFLNPLLHFWEWFNQIQAGRMLTVRDLLAWLDFVSKTEKSLHPNFAFLHGAFLVLLDGLSLGTGILKNEAAEVRERCLAFLVKQLKADDSSVIDSELLQMGIYGWADITTDVDISIPEEMQCDNVFGIHPFYIVKGGVHVEDSGFEFMAPTTHRNVLRVLRAMQLSKPVLLEGSPGVGKTSLISAIGKFSGHKVVRINLSEQTDIMDLLGSDLPIESEEGLQFAWSDGILLQALKEGSWVLLDEINLAQQSVLEGLNAILDHRAEVFIPELGQSFKCPSSFRVFACQNPSCQGGGRKGLPKSFLNRFTKVYVDELGEHDYHFICRSLFPSIPESILVRLITFNKRLYEETMVCHKFAQQGSPWEFNLRDIIRSCQIIQGSSGNSKSDCFLNVVYVQRMRTAADRKEVLRLYEEVFGIKPSINPYPRVQMDDHFLVVGNTRIKRNHFQSIKTIGSELKIFPGLRNTLEAAAQCVQHKWLGILVGPTSSGKTSLIRLLAQLTGNVLNEINLSSATDISELLGSFEQYNAYRNFHSIVSQVERYMNEYCNLQLDSSADEFLRERKDLISKWLCLSSNLSSGHMTKSDTADGYWMTSLPSLVEIIELLVLDLERYLLPVSWSLNDLSIVLQRVQKLQEIQKGRPVSAKFEWAAGLLIKAIENGEWIVLEDANLCNPTVLDRINSLVESEGSITVNECGNVDGKPLELSPHPNFRMFFTINPSQGDVSRAMRNRGIEIVMMHPYWLLNADDKEKIQALELDDIKSFLALFNIPNGMLVDSMAKAHMHARSEGLCLGVHITYLELRRWIHLFEQLLMTGNDVLWSLHCSWEHSYLSSLGEAAGWHIVQEAKSSYLTNLDSVFLGGKFIVNSRDSCSKEVTEASNGGLSLCLPGGWPAPLKLRDYVWYSVEASVRQNCLYLEYLGVQCASYELYIPRHQMLREDVYSNGSKSIYLLDLKMLQTLMYPQGQSGESISYFLSKEYDILLTKKKLLFAVDWAIDQVTRKSDFDLCLLWFSWFDSQLQPCCQFFGSLGVENLLRMELEHPIWKFIFQKRHEMSYQNVKFDLELLPILSLESAEVLTNLSVSSGKQLSNAIKCVRLLRHSLWQWNAEINENFSDKSFGCLVKSLQKLEKEVLDVIVESPSFEILHQLYTDLLEEHILFWNVFVSSELTTLLVHWRALIKIALKLRDFFPEAANNLLRSFDMMSISLNRRLPYSLNSEKSMLWAHGGHPSLPCSADICNKLQQLIGFAKLLWPRKHLQKQLDDRIVETAVSTNQEFRFLFMQGVCMSSSLFGRYEEGDIADKLQEMYEMLLKRFECETNVLEANSRSQTIGYSLGNSACCIIVPEIVSHRCGFETWIDTLPIVDETSLLLDLFLLQDLSEIILADPKELQSLVSELRDDMQNSLRFSINFSSRAPLDFVPHQEMLWIVDASTPTPEVGHKIISSVLETWFKWHSSLWNFPIVSKKDLYGSNAYKLILPNVLFKPVKTDTVQNMLQAAFVMKDYHFHCFKLRVSSSNIWQSIVPNTDLQYSLLCGARNLLLQIISSHRKSFTAEDFLKIKSSLMLLQRNKIKPNDMNNLLSLLGLSRHQKFVSLVKPFIEPLLKDIDNIHSFEVLLYHISCAWLRLGALRFHLLLACDELDPAIKFSSKYQKLVDKCQSLELESEVRHQCHYRAGSFSTRNSDDERAKLLKKHETECKRLQRKIVYRSDPGKFIKLKDECVEFSENVNSGLKLLEQSRKITNLSYLINQASNWQATASCFIDRLSEEYDSYVDIIQPIQVAIYEMKLGLALLLSSTLQTDFLGRMQEIKIDPILDAIYSIMRFPHGHPFERQVQINYGTPEFPFYSVDFSACTRMEKVDLLKKVIKSTERDGGKVTSFRLEASLLDNMLGHVVKLVSSTKILDAASFGIVDKISDFFTRLWSNAKVQEKTEKDNETQLYKFRPRPFKLDNVYEIDLSSLNNSFSGDSFTEWKEELLHEEENTISTEGNDAIDQFESSGDWNLIPESILNTMVNVHDRLFGSNNLIETMGIVQMSNAEKLNVFVKSYTLGSTLLKDITGTSVSFLDAKLVGEHMLRLCLEHEHMQPLSNVTVVSRNFYKDPNPAVVASMVELISALRKKVLSLLELRDEHPGLQKILDIIDMLLGLPPSTSVAQALSGMQFLVSRVILLQENGAKFPLADELEPIVALISSFQKMEFNVWKTMLDDVLIQFEMNAVKLWFPLYLVLHRESTTDIAEYTQFSLQSLEEFIRTSSVGEFKRRLQLMLSFYGQLNYGICLGSYASCTQKENQDVLYNVFGFYMQSLPVVMNHIASSTKNIKRELEELLKLCQWDRPEKLVSLEISKRNRQKLKKLIQKYTDALQQPVMLVLTQESEGLKSQKFDHSPDKDRELSLFDISHFDYRTTWYEDWKTKADDALQCFHGERKLNIHTSRDVDANNAEYHSALKSPGLAYKEEWIEVWHNLEIICRAVSESADMWKNEGKSQVKMRAFSDLLKLLESHGLSKHKSNLQKLLENSPLFTAKSALIDEKFKQGESNWWFFLPSYDVQHLLLKHDSLSFKEIDLNASNFIKNSNHISVEDKWRCANQYYFKSLASVRHVQQISLNFHKDFNPDQVNRCNSFLEHLVMIQMEQRAAAYDLRSQLQHLRRSVQCLKKLCLVCHSVAEGRTDEVNVSAGQQVLFRCMWQQKELFDTFCSMLGEESLMLKTVKDTHMSSCQSIKDAANGILLLIEEFSPAFEKSKVSLDNELLGDDNSAIKASNSMYPIVAGKDMEELVKKNFQLIREFQEHVLDLRVQVNKKSIEDVLLGHFSEIIEKGKNVENEFNSAKECDQPLTCAEDLTGLEAEINASLSDMFRHIGSALQELGSWSDRDASDEDLLMKITSWKPLFDSFVANFRLDLISQSLDKLISYTGKIPSISDLSSETGLQFEHLKELLVLILTFSDGLLLDFLAVHEMISVLTHRLAEIFASLFSEGYGVRTEDVVDDTLGDKTQDACGTGMGEGTGGVKDVSNEITDEDQLLGASGEKEEPDALNELPNDKVEGIEMKNDFDAPDFNLSEDTGDEDNDDDNGEDEDEQLDTAMGNTGDDSEVVDEKLCDKEEDQNLDNTNEKHEPGPSVKDRDLDNRELRAKDDTAATTDEPTEGDNDATDENDNADTSKDGTDDIDNPDSMNVDQEEANADTTDIDLHEPNQTSVDETENMEVDQDNTMEEDKPDVGDNDMDDGDPGDNTDPEDDTVAKAESNMLSEEAEDDSQNKDDKDGNMDLTAPNKDISEQGNSDLLSDHISNTQPMSQTMSEMQKAESISTAPEMQCSMSTDIQNDLASSENSNQVEMLFGNSSKGKLSNDQPQSMPQQDQSSFQKNQPNPLRNIGDALQDWKDRVKVSADVPQRDEETVDEMDDQEVDEFGFTSEFDQGTAQALGSAMPDQMEHNIGHDKPEGDGCTAQENEPDELRDDDSNTEAIHSRPISTSRVDEKINISDLHDELPVEDVQEPKRKIDGSSGKSVESLVSVRKSYMTQDRNQLSELSTSGDEPGKVQNLAQQLGEMNMNAGALWRKYELRTMRLSQELAEQLRLVMEPTLASKLQGDYRTGKRINMKKVIPYIASHYRKDKIWLRRTKPNKRDYQVVIVVDDSRSMSENCCGDFAIEALVTVCRALSQLEVGKLAVTSFGKEGNIRLLHDFDQPLTGEAGMKMISSLTFNQENTLREEPMVELLKYLNNMLEQAVANARLPSGQNPLQQLVLIIADGRFHDNKEKVKRFMRDLLQRNCLVAFIVLDSAQESIVDCKDYIFKNGLLQKAVPYLDSFPFPYYIVLRNIEMLPRTLADLLRQWLELVQQSRD
ncbi:midasin-like [Chenopodium quinoa]|uniref:midasin-like n=1 Tax=Chenopodium quinoa TaxID=63459 RepID=UPI000B793540|nr:midasin-like [Chenopodium quinoa]XP_021720498.1 midasin-like [Chenopodium quinoa]